MGGPLSQMTEAVNKIDNGSNQTNTVNGIGGSGSGLSNSNEFFSNNKVTFYFGLANKNRKVFYVKNECLQNRITFYVFVAAGSTNSLHSWNASNASHPWLIHKHRNFKDELLSITVLQQQQQYAIRLTFKSDPASTGITNKSVNASFMLQKNDMSSINRYKKEVT